MRSDVISIIVNGNQPYQLRIKLSSYWGYKNVTQNGESTQRFWKNFHGPNIGYIEEQYELFKEDPEKVDPTIRELFQQYGAPQWIDQSDQTYVDIAAPTIDLKKVTSAMKLIDAIGRHGHLEADIYPVGKENSKAQLLKLETYGLTDADLKEIDAHVLWEDAPVGVDNGRSEEHTSELQSRGHLVCRLLLEKKKQNRI